MTQYLVLTSVTFGPPSNDNTSPTLDVRYPPPPPPPPFEREHRQSSVFPVASKIGGENNLTNPPIPQAILDHVRAFADRQLGKEQLSAEALDAENVLLDEDLCRFGYRASPSSQWGYDLTES